MVRSDVGATIQMGSWIIDERGHIMKKIIGKYI
jgi:hypothetical protein